MLGRNSFPNLTALKLIGQINVDHAHGFHKVVQISLVRSFASHGSKHIDVRVLDSRGNKRNGFARGTRHAREHRALALGGAGGVDERRAPHVDVFEHEHARSLKRNAAKHARLVFRRHRDAQHGHAHGALLHLNAHSGKAELAHHGLHECVRIFTRRRAEHDGANGRKAVEAVLFAQRVHERTVFLIVFNAQPERASVFDNAVEAHQIGIAQHGHGLRRRSLVHVGRSGRRARLVGIVGRIGASIARNMHRHDG